MEEEIKKKKKQQHYNHLPHDIVEDILSRLPVKILVRFRSVCKQWKTTISSSDRFADAHLRLSRKNSLSCSHLLEQPSDSRTINATQVIDVSDKHLRVISAAIDPPPELLPPNRVQALCHCDGLQLMAGAAPNNYILWNPSNRTYKLLSYPYHSLEEEEEEYHKLYGICYDPTAMNNYKVVMGGPKGYAVFNCRSNTWSEMRDAHNTFFSRFSYCCKGTSLNGSIYWGCSTTALASEVHRRPDSDLCEIVCFDGRDEKLKCVRKLPDTNLADLHLLSSRDALYAFTSTSMVCNNEIQVMKMESASASASYTWSKTKVVRLPVPGSFIVPLPKCWIHQDKIILEELSEDEGVLLLYDHATGSVEEIHNSPEQYHPLFRGYMLPPMDNIFFCSSLETKRSTMY